MAVDIQKNQLEIDKEIASTIIECTPEEYYDFKLVLNCKAEKGDEIGTVEHILSSIDGNDETLTPSMELFTAVQKLNIFLFKSNIKWKNIVYHVYCDDNDQWQYEADFNY